MHFNNGEGIQIKNQIPNYLEKGLEEFKGYLFALLNSPGLLFFYKSCHEKHRGI